MDDRERDEVLLPRRDKRDLRPQLARAVGGVVREEIVTVRLVQEVIRYHARPWIGQTRVSVFRRFSTWIEMGCKEAWLHQGVPLGNDTPEDAPVEILILN